MYSVTQHLCRRCQMCGKCSHMNSLHSLLDCDLSSWTIYSWQSFKSLGCPLMLKTNYRCVQSLNISVDVAKCVENFHKFTQFTHFLTVPKNDLSWWTIYSWLSFNSLVCPLMLKTNYRFVQLLNISGDVAKCVENDKFTKYTHFLSVTCPDWTNLFMANFQLTRMSSFAKKSNYRCVSLNIRIRQMCGKFSQIHTVHSHFDRDKKRLVLIEQSIHGKVSTH